jgi:serine/threonine protein phosphatase PrpC
MSADEADHAPRAHAITRWLSADPAEAEQATPDSVALPLTPPGTLMLCTDGLWNYAQTDARIAELFSPASVGTEDALATCQRLVKFANEAGGQDNITVALLVLRASASPTEEPDTTPGEVNSEAPATIASEA